MMLITLCLNTQNTYTVNYYNDMEEFKTIVDMACDESYVYDGVYEIWRECYEFVENYFDRGHMKAIENVNARLKIEYTKENHKQ